MSIQKKMDSLRQQKEIYGSGAGRKNYSAPKNSLVAKHPSLPTTTNKVNHYQQSDHVSLFSTPTKRSPAAAASLFVPIPATPSHVSLYSPINQHKTPLPDGSRSGSSHGRGKTDTSSSGANSDPLQEKSKKVVNSSGYGVSSNVSSNGVKNLKVVPSLDPLQSCYGGPSGAAPKTSNKSPKTRVVQLTQEGNLHRSSSTGDVPKSILCPTSPTIGSGKKKKKKRVTFNFEVRPSSSAYAPPSHISSTPYPAPKGIGARSRGIPRPHRNVNSASGNRSMRPSLSEQLTAIADRAGDLTSDIRSKAGLDKENVDRAGEKPLMTSPAKNFTVGHLQCRYAAPVDFFADRFEYIFHHPFQNTEIHLTVYYRDMIGSSLTASPAPGKLIFRVPRHLVHFAADYDPNKHYVALFLASSVDLAWIRKNVMPRLK